jgi:hypothetical protein
MPGLTTVSDRTHGGTQDSTSGPAPFHYSAGPGRAPRQDTGGDGNHHEWERRYWREAGQARLLKLDRIECIVMVPMNAASFFAVDDAIFRVLRLGSAASFTFQLYALRYHPARYRRSRAAITLAVRSLRNLLAFLWHVGPLRPIQCAVRVNPPRAAALGPHAAQPRGSPAPLAATSAPPASRCPRRCTWRSGPS